MDHRPPLQFGKVRGNYYRGNQRHGLIEFFDQEGKLTKVMNCLFGDCKTKEIPSKNALELLPFFNAGDIAPFDMRQGARTVNEKN